MIHLVCVIGANPSLISHQGKNLLQYSGPISQSPAAADSGKTSDMGAPLLVDKDHRDHTKTFGIVRDLLRLRKTFGIRSATVVIGKESVAATTDAVVDDLMPLLRHINANVIRLDGSRVVDICAQVASPAQWIISTNPTTHQLVNDSLGVLVPRVGDVTEIITKKTLSDAGIRPEWIPAIGEPAPVISRRFLIGRTDTVKLRTTITSRYQALFAWLQDFRMAALVNGFAEYRGCRKYLIGLRSSDIDKRNRAVRSAVRWIARY